jgi:hypothetical protein
MANATVTKFDTLKKYLEKAKNVAGDELRAGYLENARWMYKSAADK